MSVDIFTKGTPDTLAQALRRRAKSAAIPQSDLLQDWITEKPRHGEEEKVKTSPPRSSS